MRNPTAVGVHVRPTPRPTAVIASVTLEATYARPNSFATAMPLAGTGRLNPMPGKRSRPLSRSDAGLTLVHRRAQIVVGERSVFLIPLHRSKCDMAIMQSHQLARVRT
jgi:hypothetical protein